MDDGSGPTDVDCHRWMGPATGGHSLRAVDVLCGRLTVVRSTNESCDR